MPLSKLVVSTRWVLSSRTTVGKTTSLRSPKFLAIRSTLSASARKSSSAHSMERISR